MSQQMAISQSRINSEERPSCERTEEYATMEEEGSYGSSASTSRQDSQHISRQISPPGSPAVGSGSTGSNKRPRKIASRACDACSKRKVRCNQASPKCGPCEVSGLRCQYTRPTNRRGRPSTITKEFMETSENTQGDLSAGFDTTFNFPPLPSPPIHTDTQNISTNQGFMRLEQILSMPMPKHSNQSLDNTHFTSPSDSSHLSASLNQNNSRNELPPSEAFSSISDAPASGLDNVIPWPAVSELVDRFFIYLWPRLPIIHQPSFRQDMQDRRDRDSAPWYMLALNVCAASSIACRALPMPDVLSQLGYDWESLARHLNSCLRQLGAWIHSMARASSLVCLQNVLLVAFFERCIGSPIADRLSSEAQRVAQAFHFNMEIPGLDAVEAELRRRIFWVLYNQDKLDAIVHRRSMSLRLDEVMVELPSMQLSEHIMDPAIDTGELLRPFLQRTQACQVAESILLRWRADLRMPAQADSAASVRRHLHESLEQLVRSSAKTSGLQHDVALAVNEASTILLEGCLKIDLYHRYLTLLDEDRAALSERLCSVGAKLSNRLCEAPVLSLQMLEPPTYALLETAYRRVETSAVHIIDPLAKHDATEATHTLHTLSASARSYAEPRETENVNTASIRSSSGANGAFENAGLPSENVLPQEFPSVPMLTGQTGLGTLDFLNDLSTSSLQTADWFNFFDT